MKPHTIEKLDEKFSKYYQQDAFVVKINQIIDAYTALREHVINTEEIAEQNKIVDAQNAASKERSDIVDVVLTKYWEWTQTHTPSWETDNLIGNILGWPQWYIGFYKPENKGKCKCYSYRDHTGCLNLIQCDVCRSKS